MIITISGRVGSGKTTSGKILAKKLHYKFYFMGDVRRKWAKEKGLTIAELNKQAEKDPTTDINVDKYQAKLAKKEKNLVIDSRLGYLFIPKSTKIYLDADINTRVRRIAKVKRTQESYKNIAEASKALKAREKSDVKRYKRLYKTNPYQAKHYDLLIDTTNLTIKRTVDLILRYLRSFAGQQRSRQNRKRKGKQ